MTFDDIDEVIVDFDAGVFVIIRKSGQVNGEYSIEGERELFDKLYDNRNEFPMYSVSDTEET